MTRSAWAVVLGELDPHAVAAVFQGVLQELAEDERQGGCTVACDRDRVELCVDFFSGR